MDEDTRQVMESLRRDIDHLWKYLGHKDAAAKFQREADESYKKVEDFKKEFAEQQAALQENTARYMNVVALVGYFGYFTTWSYTLPLMTAQEKAIVGLAGLLSVGLFIAWEILTMILRFHAAITFTNLIKREFLPDEFFAKLEAAKHADHLRSVRFTWVWIIVLSVTILLVVIGAGVLIKVLVASLFGPEAPSAD